MGPLGCPSGDPEPEHARPRVGAAPSVGQNWGRAESNGVGGRRQVPGSPTGAVQGSATWGAGPEDGVVQILTFNHFSFSFIHQASQRDTELEGDPKQ